MLPAGMCALSAGCPLSMRQPVFTYDTVIRQLSHPVSCQGRQSKLASADRTSLAFRLSGHTDVPTISEPAQ